MNNFFSKQATIALFIGAIAMNSKEALGISVG
jgi:hypothetical protein